MDFYDEGMLIWLEADTIVRQHSGGKKSMDDFARLFYGGHNTPPEVKTYTFDDVVNALNHVQPFDWRGFFNDRVKKIAVHAPLAGIENSGWMVVYTDQPNTIERLREQQGSGFVMIASIGVVLSKDGTVMDAVEDGIAAKNGIGPGMKIIAVNGRKYTQDFLVAAMHEAQNSHQPIQLLIENTDYYRNVSLNYFDGPRHPHLMRDNSRPDLLSNIFAPKVTTPPASLPDAE